MAMTYSDLVTLVASAIVVPTTNSDFLTAFPGWITYSEGRIYRELDMLDANIRDSSSACTPGSRNFNLPVTVGTFLILDGINIITPAGSGAEAGTRNPLTPVSRDFLDYAWPSLTGSTVPQYFAYFSQNTYLTESAAQKQVLFGPWPDLAYTVECVGKFQPAPLSATNPSTYLTDNLFDLMFSAMMIAASSWQMNFGSAGTDNPQMATTWEATYGKLLQSAATWEARKRFAGASWTAKALEQEAQPQRG